MCGQMITVNNELGPTNSQQLQSTAVESLPRVYFQFARGLLLKVCGCKLLS